MQLTEPLNGIILEDTRQYGVVNFVPVMGSTTEFFVRLSRPLLRMLVAESHFIEKLVGDDADTLVDDLPLTTVLRTCRTYHATHQEVVQMLSWLTTLYTWLLLCNRPAPCWVSLRPGALVNPESHLRKTADYMRAAAAEVDAAGQPVNGRMTMEQATARSLVAFQLVPKLVPRGDRAEAGFASLSAAASGQQGGVAIDSAALVARPGWPVAAEQSKGVIPDDNLTQAQPVVTTRLKSNIYAGLARWEDWPVTDRDSGADIDPRPAVVIELLDLHRSTRTLKASDLPMEAVVITAQTLRQAIAPPFAGFISRCFEAGVAAARQAAPAAAGAGAGGGAAAGAGP